MGIVCKSLKPKTSLNDIQFGNQQLEYSITITNIKLKYYQQDSAYISLTSPYFKHHTYIIRYTKTPQVKLFKQPFQWNQEYTEHISIDSEELKTKHLKIQVLNDKHISSYTKRLSFYQIAVGPQSYDYDTISFDIIMSQKISIKIISKELTCHLNQQLNHIAYTFNIGLKNKFEKISQLSNKYLNPAFQEQATSPYKYKSLCKEKLLKPLHDLQWEFRDDPPQLEVDLHYSDFQTTTFIIQIFAYDNQNYIPIGQSYISLIQLLNQNSFSIAQTKMMSITESKFTENLKSLGNIIGEIKTKLILSTNQYTKQCTGIMTLKGIVNQSEYMIQKYKTQDEQPLLIALQKLIEKKITQQQILDILKIMRNQIQNPRQLIQVMKFILNQYKQQVEDNKKLFLTVFIEIIYRKELDLEHFLASKTPQMLKVASQFIKIIYKALDYSLIKLIDGTCHDIQLECYSKILVKAFHIIPEFRTQFQNNIGFNEKQFYLEFQFYSWLSTIQKGSQLIQEIKKTNYKIPKEQVFDQFIYYWIDYIQLKYTLQQEILGYNELTNEFINSSNQGNLCLKASIKLLKNPMLLNKFVFQIFSTTNLYNPAQVFDSLDFINSITIYVCQENQKLPSNFDFNYYIKGLKMVLDSDHAQSICKALQLIYNIFQYLTSDQKLEVSELLLGEIFFTLFIHWSYSVRNCFIQLLVFKFQHKHKQLKSGLDSIEDLNKEIKTILVNPNKVSKENVINDLIFMKYTQNLDIIEGLYQNQQNQKQHDTTLRGKLTRRKLEQEESLTLRCVTQEDQLRLSTHSHSTPEKGSLIRFYSLKQEINRNTTYLLQAYKQWNQTQLAYKKWLKGKDSQNDIAPAMNVRIQKDESNVEALF
ncbi:hypothetical protein pb186bvf_011532 [Paramecium bursaria]